MSTCSDDSINLERFVEAQAGIYDAALSELRAGKKRSHWMWFVFPQIAGLGFSSTAAFYAIKSPAEARAYLSHPVLGPRLEECTRALLNLEGLSASRIFGYPDDLKFCSSMTLFEHAAPDNPLFQAAIDKYYGGRRDEKTLGLLSGLES